MALVGSDLHFRPSNSDKPYFARDQTVGKEKKAIGRDRHDLVWFRDEGGKWNTIGWHLQVPVDYKLPYSERLLLVAGKSDGKFFDNLACETSADRLAFKRELRVNGVSLAEPSPQLLQGENVPVFIASPELLANHSRLRPIFGAYCMEPPLPGYQTLCVVEFAFVKNSKALDSNMCVLHAKLGHFTCTTQPVFVLTRNPGIKTPERTAPEADAAVAAATTTTTTTTTTASTPASESADDSSSPLRPPLHAVGKQSPMKSTNKRTRAVLPPITADDFESRANEIEARAERLLAKATRYRKKAESLRQGATEPISLTFTIDTRSEVSEGTLSFGHDFFGKPLEESGFEPLFPLGSRQHSLDPGRDEDFTGGLSLPPSLEEFMSPEELQAHRIAYNRLAAADEAVISASKSVGDSTRRDSFDDSIASLTASLSLSGFNPPLDKGGSKDQRLEGKQRMFA